MHGRAGPPAMARQAGSRVHRKPGLAHLLRSNAKFKHLQLRVAVNELRHGGQVAELLHLPQSAVSKSLAELDLVIGRLDAIPDPGGLAVETLYQDAVVAVTAIGSALAGQTALRWGDMAEQPWTLPPSGSFVRTRFDALVRQYGWFAPRDIQRLPARSSAASRSAMARAAACRSPR